MLHSLVSLSRNPVWIIRIIHLIREALWHLAKQMVSFIEGFPKLFLDCKKIYIIHFIHMSRITGWLFKSSWSASLHCTLASSFWLSSWASPQCPLRLPASAKASTTTKASPIAAAASGASPIDTTATRALSICSTASRDSPISATSSRTLPISSPALTASPSSFLLAFLVENLVSSHSNWKQISG